MKNKSARYNISTFSPNIQTKKDTMIKAELLLTHFQSNKVSTTSLKGYFKQRYKAREEKDDKVI